MANKRMFNLLVINTDAFLEMPLSTQALYFHLNMRADDDGFISNPKRIVRYIGASEDDLKLLIAKRFVLIFENGVMVIKHWRMHNTIQKDRYTPTNYQEEYSLLEIKKNKAYTLDKGICIQNVSNMDTECIQNVSPDIDIDIDKDIDKDINNINAQKNLSECDQKKSKKEVNSQYSQDFETIYKQYPRHKGKAKAFAAYKLFVTTGKDISGQKYKFNNKQLWTAVVKFKHECEEKGTEEQYIPYFDTFMNGKILDYMETENE